MSPEAIKPELELLFEARAALGPPVTVGETPQGPRRVVPITGGTFAGPAMRGEILPGGADWQYDRADGATVLDARYLLRTNDHVVLEVTNHGLRHGPSHVLRRVAAGEDVDPASYYFRASPAFSAPKGRYEWLNRSLFLCTGARSASAVTLWFFRVL
ncbi:MAG: DUF3237 domain-containing protein [Steroidobacteraceae bacterium]